MTVLMVPNFDDVPWPTLGAGVCDFIQSYLVFGPGDLRGLPAVLDEEKRMLIWRWYEVYPQEHPWAGRRRFKRVGLSHCKGYAKTELAAWIAACELHHDGPVRTIGWSNGQPIGGPIRDPYIPMIAYDEEQTELLAYGALKTILEESRIARDFDIGLERITRRRGDGRAEALSTSPNARDGARTTFQHFDESALMVLPRQKRTHSTMLANITKREAADGWSLETTTAPEPGAGSVAEGTMQYAQAVSQGRISDNRLFFFHRQASDEHDLDQAEGARAALEEALGPMLAWSDIESKMALWHDPQYARSEFERYFLNRLVKSASRAFDAQQWATLAYPEYAIPDGALVTLGFDGALFHDGTGLVATEAETGFQQVVGAWEQPYGPAGENWQVPEEEVNGAVAWAMKKWNVWRMYCDPPYWEGWVARWAGEYGNQKVVEFRTNRPGVMSRVLQEFQTAIQTAQLSHDGNEVLARHVANAYKQELRQLDEQGRPYWYIRKERADSPNKIDLCMAAVLSWESRNDALAAGMVHGAGGDWTFGAR